jgi:hypothetical protein
MLDYLLQNVTMSSDCLAASGGILNAHVNSPEHLDAKHLDVKHFYAMLLLHDEHFRFHRGPGFPTGSLTRGLVR